MVSLFCCYPNNVLGLAVQLHHRFGSSELIRILCEHGLISFYDEVLEFRKSYQNMCLKMKKSTTGKLDCLEILIQFSVGLTTIICLLQAQMGQKLPMKLSLSTPDYP